MPHVSLSGTLRDIRLELGLSQHDLAERIGVSESSVQQFEADRKHKGCQTQAKMKIIGFINSRKDNWLNFDSLNPIEQQKLEGIKTAVIHSFIKGKKYCIFDTGNNAKTDSECFNPLTGKGCVFIYLRKEGKHHVFREGRGGWIRTYTDNQLIGKKIKEAEHD